MITALAAFLVAYRFYGAFLAAKVAVLNDRNVTPAHRLRDDVDYQPTRRLVLFGVHFAAIAGSGPLVGPVLASQWGYFPGFCWIVVGACLAGGVHDFVVLLASVRHDGQSLPQIARDSIGPLSGVVTTLATAFIIVATLAGVAIVVVNALSESAWGMFTIIGHDPGRADYRPVDVQDPAGLRGRGVADRRQPGAPGRVPGKAFRRFGLGRLPGFQQAAVVDHSAGVCRDRLDLAGMGVAVPAELSQFLHEDRRDRRAGDRHLCRPART